MRVQGLHLFVFWIGIVLLIVLLGVLAGGSVALRGESAPTPTPSPTATIPATAPGPLFSDSHGSIALPGSAAPAELRRETDPAPTSVLRGQGFIGAVSGTGRRVAYWISSTTDGATRELRVFDVTAPIRTRPWRPSSTPSAAAAAVWSSDRTGVVAVVESSAPGTGEAPGPF